MNENLKEILSEYNSRLGEIEDEQDHDIADEKKDLSNVIYELENICEKVEDLVEVVERLQVSSIDGADLQDFIEQYNCVKRVLVDLVKKGLYQTTEYLMLRNILVYNNIFRAANFIIRLDNQRIRELPNKKAQNEAYEIIYNMIIKENRTGDHIVKASHNDVEELLKNREPYGNDNIIFPMHEIRGLLENAVSNKINKVKIIKDLIRYFNIVNPQIRLFDKLHNRCLVDKEYCKQMNIENYYNLYNISVYAKYVHSENMLEDEKDKSRIISRKITAIKKKHTSQNEQ